MSVASTTAKVGFISKGGSYTAMLNCTFGDLFQFYSTTAGATSYTPDFAMMAQADRPVISFDWQSSYGASSLQIVACNWYFNDVLLFSGSAYQGLFTRIDSTHIRLDGNPGMFSGNASATLKAVATLTSGDEISASTSIRITQGSDQSCVVTICSAANSANPNHFVIDSKDPNAPGYKCRLGARCFVGNSEPSVYFKWYKMNLTAATGWEEIGVQDVIEVIEPNVGTWGQYKVEAYNDAACTGNPLGSDVQEVLDYSDELAIDVTYNPADATIVDGDPTRQSVTITPRVVCSDTGATAPGFESATFNFFVPDASGNNLNVGAAPSTSITIGIDTARQAGGDVRVIIETTV